MEMASADLLRLQTTFTYGVRAVVDDHTGFAYGRSPTHDAIVVCAHNAVRNARIAARLSARTSRQFPAWTPAPPATGEWHSPMRIDPLAVSVQQHFELAHAATMAVGRMPNTQASITPAWLRETRVFAATTGALTTQYVTRGMFDATGSAQFGLGAVAVQLPELQWQSAGVELLLPPDLPERLRTEVESVMPLARLPIGSIEVGRHPIVLDGAMMGNVLTTLIGPSFELDRVLGLEVDAAGSSRLTLDALGTRIMSPLITLVGNRTPPSISAVQWDDDGNVPQEHTVVKDGVLVDFHTSAHTVAALGEWYQRQHRPLQSNGCGVAIEAQESVHVRMPHVTMRSGGRPMSLDDLCADMGHGILGVYNARLTSDAQLSSGTFPTGTFFEVVRGKPVRRIAGTVLQFSTFPFVNHLKAVGDASTVATWNDMVPKGFPWINVPCSATAPAALFGQIDAMNP